MIPKVNAVPFTSYLVMRKFSFAVDILTEDDMFHHKLYRYLNIILSLGMLRDGKIMRSKADFENINHVVRSQVTDKFTFGKATKKT